MHVEGKLEWISAPPVAICVDDGRVVERRGRLMATSGGNLVVRREHGGADCYLSWIQGPRLAAGTIGRLAGARHVAIDTSIHCRRDRVCAQHSIAHARPRRLRRALRLSRASRASKHLRSLARALARTRRFGRIHAARQNADGLPGQPQRRR